MNTSPDEQSQQEPRNLFSPAKATDFPKSYIHKSTILVTGGEDRSGDPYYVWVTAAPRSSDRLHLRAYQGDENVRGFVVEHGEKLERRECFATFTAATWKEAKEWLGSLHELRYAVSPHSDTELEQLAGVFRKLRPAWFKAGNV